MAVLGHDPYGIARYGPTFDSAPPVGAAERFIVAGPRCARTTVPGPGVDRQAVPAGVLVERTVVAGTGVYREVG